LLSFKPGGLFGDESEGFQNHKTTVSYDISHLNREIPSDSKQNSINTTQGGKGEMQTTSSVGARKTLSKTSSAMIKKNIATEE